MFRYQVKLQSGFSETQEINHDFHKLEQAVACCERWPHRAWIYSDDVLHAYWTGKTWQFGVGGY